jgi:tellurite resistance protein
MSRVVLNQELADEFAAALLAVIRADHEITSEEGRAVQEVVAGLVEGATVDFADAMLVRSSPESFAAAVQASTGSPYRGTSVSPAAEIAEAFAAAARRVAGADGNFSAAEGRVVESYLAALAAPTGPG